MNGIISEIKNFYFYYHTAGVIKKEDPNELIVKTSLCTRMDFVNAVFDGLAFLICNVATTIFSAIVVTATMGFAPKFKKYFYKNSYEAIVHAGSIPVSIIGIIHPKIVNRHFIKQKLQELKIERKPDTLSSIVNLVGTIFIRKRLPT